MNRKLTVAALVAGLGLTLGSSGTVRSNGGHDDDEDDARIRRGLNIAPVPLNFRKAKRDRVGLGSYIVNAQAVCSDCHSCPTYASGGNPYVGQPTRLNTENYLAGGVPFGPFTSRNITPDDDGLPAGLSFEAFLSIMRTGHRPGSTNIRQVMPWPVYGNMTNHDLRAIYEYLKAIPPAEPGSCTGPGEAAP